MGLGLAVALPQAAFGDGEEFRRLTRRTSLGGCLGRVAEADDLVADAGIGFEAGIVGLLENFSEIVG